MAIVSQNFMQGLFMFCFGLVFYPDLSVLLHFHQGKHIISPMAVKHFLSIWENASYEFT